MENLQEKLLTFKKLIHSYVQEKEKILTQLSKSQKILHNQIDHYNYVKNTTPSQDFLSKFENVPIIVLEKINKRIENEMKEFVDSRSHYVSLFNQMKSASQDLISDMKIDADSLTDLPLSKKQMNTEFIEKEEIRSDSKTRGKSKRKSMTDTLGKSDIVSETNVIPLDGLYIVTESLRDIVVLENMNIIKLINVNNYEMMKTFSLDGFKEADEKFRSISHLIKCFL